MTKIIAVDFDCTLEENRWPGIGTAKTDIIDSLDLRDAAFEEMAKFGHFTN